MFAVVVLVKNTVINIYRDIESYLKNNNMVRIRKKHVF